MWCLHYRLFLVSEVGSWIAIEIKQMTTWCGKVKAKVMWNNIVWRKDCYSSLKNCIISIFQSFSLVLSMWNVVLSGRRGQLSLSARGLLSFLRRNFLKRCTLLAVMDLHFLNVKEAYVAIKIFGNSGMFYFAVRKQYTEEISCFQVRVNFLQYSQMLWEAVLLCFLFIFPQILLCCLLIIFYLAHGYAAEAITSTASLLGNKYVLMYILGNLSSADVTEEPYCPWWRQSNDVIIRK